MEVLTVLQALSTPILAGLSWVATKVWIKLHAMEIKFETRLALLEFEIREHRKTEPDYTGAKDSGYPSKHIRQG